MVCRRGDAGGPATVGMIPRGERQCARLDLGTARWERNEFGVDVLMLSQDAVSGALTMALRTPAGLAWPEREHYYTCDQDLFQFEGEFHHDEERPFLAGDYVYRPPGTVYGHSPGSAGGVIIAALNGRPRRHHFDDHPPWTGEYLVDRDWHSRAVQPCLVHGGELAWEDAGLGGGILQRRLRGRPGQRADHYGARPHSPWGADAAWLLRLPAGYAGVFPAWPDTLLEVLVTAGRARVAGADWYRGCYAFDGLKGDCTVSEDFECYLRGFLPPAPEHFRPVAEAAACRA